VDTFLDYHHRRQSYENDLRQHENALKKAKKEYADAAHPAHAFSARWWALTLHYQGERNELLSTEYVLVRKQGAIVSRCPAQTPNS
jgi:hypothetical protein